MTERNTGEDLGIPRISQNIAGFSSCAGDSLGLLGFCMSSHFLLQPKDEHTGPIGKSTLSSGVNMNDGFGLSCYVAL